MGNNKEIRQRMETYRTVLLVLNWIGVAVLIIVGLVMANNRYSHEIGVGIVIYAIVIGIGGHFLINLALSIPFILLNNGDTLETLSAYIKDVTISANDNASKTAHVPDDWTTDNIVTVCTEMKLYKSEFDYDNVVAELKTGTKLKFIKTGAQVKIGEMDGNMWYVQTAGYKTGWGFSGFMKKAGDTSTTDVSS